MGTEGGPPTAAVFALLSAPVGRGLVPGIDGAAAAANTRRAMSIADFNV